MGEVVNYNKLIMFPQPFRLKDIYETLIAFYEDYEADFYVESGDFNENIQQFSKHLYDWCNIDVTPIEITRLMKNSDVTTCESFVETFSRAFVENVELNRKFKECHIIFEN